MPQIDEKILENPLFHGIAPQDVPTMLSCLGAFEKTYAKHETILQRGDPVTFVGIVMQGSAKIVNLDYNGNEVLVATIAPGDLFAEAFACIALLRSPVSVVALEESRVLLFQYGKMITTCCASCQFHQQLIANMLSVVAWKTLYLNQRIDLLSKRSLRDKLLTYLHHESQGRATFTIPMQREALANFLCADRSALSNELSKMKRDGLIDYHKSTFTLLH